MYITMQITPRVVITKHFLFIDIQFKTWVKYIFRNKGTNAVSGAVSCQMLLICAVQVLICTLWREKKAHCFSNFYGVQNVYHVNLVYHVPQKIPLSKLHCDYSIKRDSHVTVNVSFMLMQSSRNKSSKTRAHIDICYLRWICMRTHELSGYIELHKNAWEGHMLMHVLILLS